MLAKAEIEFQSRASATEMLCHHLGSILGINVRTHGTVVGVELGGGSREEV